jgi:hypothetical protein
VFIALASDQAEVIGFGSVGTVAGLAGSAVCPMTAFHVLRCHPWPILLVG